MKKAEIIEILKKNQRNSFEVEQAFELADKDQNFAFKFGKTKEYWGKKEWDVVAKEVKKNMEP